MFIRFHQGFTKKKQAEIALQQNEAKYRTFIEEAVDAILVLSPKEGRYKEANRKASELLGYSLQEYCKLKSRILFFPGDNTPIPFERLEAGESVTIERYLRKKNGEKVAVETSARKLPDGNYLAFLRDISKRKKSGTGNQ